MDIYISLKTIFIPKHIDTRRYNYNWYMYRGVNSFFTKEFLQKKD